MIFGAGKSLSERIVIAKVCLFSSSSMSLTGGQVDGKLWDLERPIEKACRLELLDFETEEG
jgi:threonyl-tRNA synthetase